MPTRIALLRLTWVSAFAITSVWCCRAHAQFLTIHNSSFEDGTAMPDGWRLSEGEGKWLDSGAASGKRAIAVTGTGDSANEWRSTPIALAPSGAYRLRFRARSLGGHGGTAVSGIDTCNRDLGDLKPDWESITSYFAVPENITPDSARLRFGQWHVNGAVAFDDVDICPVQPIYASRSGIELGDGESIDGFTYVFEPRWGATQTNQSRTLLHNKANFNTNRWIFGADQELVYRQQIAGRRQVKARIEVSITNYSQGELNAQASADGVHWKTIGNARANGVVTWEVPADLFPASEVLLRLKSVGSAAFTLASYRYTATIEGDPLPYFSGATRYAAVTQHHAQLDVKVLGVGDGLPGGINEVALGVDNPANVSTTTAPTIIIQGATERAFRANGPLKPGKQTVRIPYDLADAGAWTLRITMGNPDAYTAEVPLLVPDLYAAHYGERLPSASDALGVWWASSGWKISKTRPAPEKTGTALRIALARNEVEAAQLVLRPKSTLTGVTLAATALRGPGDAVIPADAVEILRERYVSIQQATDSAGAAGLWPDPLPPITGPMELPGGVNHPLWVRVKTPRGIPAGRYTGTIAVSGSAGRTEIPMLIEVFDFDLPDRMTCVTAFGFSPENVFQYHKTSTPEQKRAVLDKYLSNLGAHHITPYDPAPLDKFTVTWPAKDGSAAPTELAPTIDWTAWDAAMDRAFRVYHFNSFQLPSPGMGGGTFFDRVEPELQGFKDGTPQYQAMFTSYYRQVQDHLRAKGWLQDAYVYWFDEPDPKDYAFVMNGFRKLKDAAPDIPRMLTEQVEPGLVGGPNVWCPISNEYQHAAAETRRAQGDRFWWYICTGPKAPYCTEFIDHPATEPRVWLWQTWRRNITGILIWQTNYWTSATAYTDPAHPQNPYDDPMSWTVGYGTPAGSRLPWGNGDGRFIYPPEEAATAQQDHAVLQGPVDSIRWELLRDGIEDYEYLVILRGALDRLGATSSQDDRAPFAALLNVPGEITADMTSFARDPAPIEARREAIARAIERVSRR